MGKRGPLAATDRRRQAGHHRPRRAGADQDDPGQGNGSGQHIAHLFRDRRTKMGEGKRAS